MSAQAFRDAQDAGLEAELRARRSADSWRRVASAVSLVALIEGLTVCLQVFRVQHDVIVYRESARGLALMSEGVPTRMPSEQAVEQQLGLWVADVQDVPGLDESKAQLNQNLALLMTARSSPANAKLEDLYRAGNAENPFALGRQETRTVDTLGFTASPIHGTHTYLLNWPEKTTINGRDVHSICTGSAAIAQPSIPDNAALGAVNPVGLYVEDFEFRCESVRQ